MPGYGEAGTRLATALASANTLHESREVRATVSKGFESHPLRQKAMIPNDLRVMLILYSRHFSRTIGVILARLPLRPWYHAAIVAKRFTAARSAGAMGAALGLYSSG
jgi:hypothetical protein